MMHCLASSKLGGIVPRCNSRQGGPLSEFSPTPRQAKTRSLVPANGVHLRPQTVEVYAEPAISSLFTLPESAGIIIVSE